jgi:hypothetical protein
MKQRGISQRSRIENPVWCDHCRVRIAPYEEIAVTGTKAFHARCVQKEEIKKSNQGPLGESDLTFALA